MHGNAGIPRPLRGIAPFALSITMALACLLVGDVVAQDPSDTFPAPAPATSEHIAPEPTQTAGQTSAIPVENLGAALRDGGPLLIPLGFCSFLLCVFVFERAISLRRGRVIPKPFVKRFLLQLSEGQLERKEALARCQENRSPVAEVFAAGVMKWHRPAVEVEQAMIDGGERVANSLRRYLRLFNGISTISPLVGLLGTVVGMIRAFNAIATADAMGRPELLAAGISQALLTTAAGLTVAIPAIIAYLFFASRVDRLIIDIDSLAQEVVHAIACDTWKEPDKRKPSARSQQAKAA
jgi:biopolymer transport protein ExbB